MTDQGPSGNDPNNPDPSKNDLPGPPSWESPGGQSAPPPFEQPTPNPQTFQQPAQQWPPQGQHQGQPADVPDYLVWSILLTLFCCLPLGIAGIVYSSQANNKKHSGDIAGAMQDAASAKRWITIGAIVGGLVYALSIIGYVVLLAVSFSSV